MKPAPSDDAIIDLSGVRPQRTRGTTLAADLLRLTPALADRKGTFAAMVAIGLVGSLLDAVAISLVSALLYLSIGGGGQVRPPAMLQRLLPFDLGRLFQQHFWLLCVIVVAALLLRIATVGLYSIIAASLKSLVFHRLRVRLFQRYMFAPFESISQSSYGFLSNALQVEAPRVAELIDQLFRIPIAFCGAAVIFLVLMMLSWPVACLVVAAGLCLAIFLQFSRVYLHRLSQHLLVLNEALASRMLAGVQSLRTIRAFAAEGREFDRFSDASRSAARVSVRFAIVENIVMPSGTLATLVLIALVILLSNALGNPAATTLTIVALLYRLQPQLQGLQASVTSIHGLESSLALVVGIISEPVPAMPALQPLPGPGTLSHSIRFHDVSYRHPISPEPTLKQISFEIPRGLVTAIVGRSGAGKTTILNLLLRLTEPSSGTIEVDGISLASIDRMAWLRQVAIAGQDIDVLSGSILDNLRLGCPDLAPEAAMEALVIAGIGEFVRSLPDGMATRVGERGHRLSGGQRQRIALARAIAMKPQLLILDEATNAVDAPLEVAIHQRLRVAFPDLTILIVAHRSSALSEADVVIDIADGRVSSVCLPHPNAAA